MCQPLSEVRRLKTVWSGASVSSRSSQAESQVVFVDRRRRRRVAAPLAEDGGSLINMSRVIKSSLSEWSFLRSLEWRSHNGLVTLPTSIKGHISKRLIVLCSTKTACSFACSLRRPPGRPAGRPATPSGTRPVRLSDRRSVRRRPSVRPSVRWTVASDHTEPNQQLVSDHVECRSRETDIRRSDESGIAASDRFFDSFPLFLSCNK